jgi:hypothetical protein
VKKLFLFAAAFLLFFAPLLAAAEELSVKVFVLRYRRVEEAALLIRGHLSDAASVTLTQRLNAMTVTDREENLKTVAKVLAGFDVPPRGFTFAVKLVRARADVPAGSISQEIGGLGAKLKSLFQFNDYTLIDSAVLRGVEGRRVECRLGEEYNLSFGIGPTGAGGDDLVLGGFTLARLRKNEQGTDRPHDPLSGSDAHHHQPDARRGASREERSKSALILILLAQELSRSEVEKGAADARTVERHP